MRKHAWKALAAMCLAASLLGGCGGAVAGGFGFAAVGAIAVAAFVMRKKNRR